MTDARTTRIANAYEAYLNTIDAESADAEFNCICFLEPGHGPSRHECACGNLWAVGEASPDCNRTTSDSGHDSGPAS